LFKKKLLQVCVLISFLSISNIAIFKVTKQTYGVNDDVIIQNWLSGFYTGTPELMIRGSATPRISFGFIVSNLYDLIPIINWFSIILLGSTLFSWYLLGLLAFRSNNFLAIAVYFLISFLHLLWFIPSPTYTAAAVILSFSTLIFLSKQILDDKVNYFFVPISITYVFSFLMRPESFLLGSAVTVPFILFAVIKKKHAIKKDFKYILTSLSLIISIIGIDIAFENIYTKIIQIGLNIEAGNKLDIKFRQTLQKKQCWIAPQNMAGLKQRQKYSKIIIRLIQIISQQINSIN
jgi:hypothetical protein